MSIIVPPHIVKQLNKKYNLEEEAYFFDDNSYNRKHCIRMNPRKRVALLHYDNQIPWYEDGYFSTRQINPQSDPLFHAGCYCIQDPSSMFIAYMLKALQADQSPIHVLDILGGSGTLGTLILDNVHPESLVVVNEGNKSQLKSLISTLEKWGNANSFVANNAPTIFSSLPAYFDLVLVYPPNSGIQQNNKNAAQWHEAIGLFHEQQKHILTHGLASLKTNGTLIYATNSTTEEEYGEILNWLCKEQHMELILLPINPSWKIEEKVSGKRTIGFGLKNKFDNETLFVTALRKKEEQERFARSDKNTHHTVPSHKELVKKWIDTDVEMSTVIKNDLIHLFPASLINDVNTLEEHLTLKKTGIGMGKLAGDLFIPHKSLAFSTLLHPEIPKKTLSKEDALHFIKKGEQYKKSEERSSTLLTYEGLGLGWS